jgi:hypothetical protein
MVTVSFIILSLSLSLSLSAFYNYSSLLSAKAHWFTKLFWFEVNKKDLSISHLYL